MRDASTPVSVQKDLDGRGRWAQFLGSDEVGINSQSVLRFKKLATRIYPRELVSIIVFSSGIRDWGSDVGTSA